MNNDASWSMTWDGDGKSDNTFEQMSLQIPRGKVLLAKVFGAPSPKVKGPRTTYLCVDASGAVVTRNHAGWPLWSSVDQGPSANGFTRLMPDDPGGECSAMTDGWHLVEWLNSTRYSVNDEQLTGHTESHRPFSAKLDSELRFVRHVDLHVGSGQPHRLIEVQEWRLVDGEPELLEPVALDLRGRLT